MAKEAISFLETFLVHHSPASVLEFGMGASTLWFSKRTPHLVSIEHDVRWHQTVIDALQEKHGENLPWNLILHNRPYYQLCSFFELNRFDLILVDGRDRIACVQASLPILKEGGCLMLDDGQRPAYAPIHDQLARWPHFSCKHPIETWGDSHAETHWWIKKG